VLRDGDLVVDLAAREATLAGMALVLTVREFDLLAFLMRNPRQVHERRQLLEQVRGWSFGDLSTVTVHVRRLLALIGRPGVDAAATSAPLDTCVNPLSSA
jgi:DNA-binding response OmpR family regulator